MRVIENHGLDDIVLTQVLGWKWMSFISVPVRGTEGYPNECRVRQLFPPEQLESQEWIAFFRKKGRQRG